MSACVLCPPLFVGRNFFGIPWECLPPSHFLKWYTCHSNLVGLTRTGTQVVFLFLKIKTSIYKRDGCGDLQSFCKTGCRQKKINNADRKIFYLLDYFFLFCSGVRVFTRCHQNRFFQFRTVLRNKSLKPDDRRRLRLRLEDPLFLAPPLVDFIFCIFFFFCIRFTTGEQ